METVHGVQMAGKRGQTGVADGTTERGGAV